MENDIWWKWHSKTMFNRTDRHHMCLINTVLGSNGENAIVHNLASNHNTMLSWHLIWTFLEALTHILVLDFLLYVCFILHVYVLEVLGYNDIYVVRTTYMLLYPLATGDTYGRVLYPHCNNCSNNIIHFFGYAFNFFFTSKRVNVKVKTPLIYGVQ